MQNMSIEKLLGIVTMLGIGGLVVEHLTEIVKKIVAGEGAGVERIIPLLFGILIAVGFNLDAPSLVGIVSPIPYFGAFITGIAISGGAGLIYERTRQGKDLAYKLQGLLKDEIKDEIVE